MFGKKNTSRVVEQQLNSLTKTTRSKLTIPVNDGTKNSVLYVNPDADGDERKAKAGKTLFQTMFNTALVNLVGEQHEDDFAVQLFEEFIASNCSGLLDISSLNNVFSAKAYEALSERGNETTAGMVCDYIITMALFPSKVSLDTEDEDEMDFSLSPRVEDIMSMSEQINDTPLSVLSEIFDIPVATGLDNGASPLQCVFDAVEEASIQHIQDVVPHEKDIHGNNKDRAVIRMTFFTDENKMSVPDEIVLVPVLTLSEQTLADHTSTYFLDNVRRSSTSDDVYFCEHPIISAIRR